MTAPRPDEERFARALRGIVPPGAALHEPQFNGSEWTMVKDCLDTGWVSTAGAYVNAFEAALSTYCGAEHAVATVNGTAALQVCLLLAGVRPGDEVLVPSLTFVATANAVTYCGATPHFVDSNHRTLGVDAEKLADYLKANTREEDGVTINVATGRPVRALVGMHVFGHAIDLDAVVELCQRHAIVFVEDAAESLGSYYNGRHTGNRGAVAALSFNGNKIVTTGGGGAVLTNDAGLAARARHLTTTAKVAHPWDYDHDCVGFNYRLPNINAALGCAQMACLDERVDKKRQLAARYAAAFADIDGIDFFREPEGRKSNYWLNAVLLSPALAPRRDAFLETAIAAGFQVRPAWKPMHELPMFADCPRMDLSVTTDLRARLINLPSSPQLMDADHG